MSKRTRRDNPPPEPVDESDLEEGADEERYNLTGHGALGEELPLPDDAHAEDLELHGHGRIPVGGPPSHRRLSPDVEELGARELESLTQEDPSASEEGRELEDETADDEELSLRQVRFPDEVEEEEQAEERPRGDEEGPVSPSGSPPNA